MLLRELIVTAAVGLHARPAAQFAEVAKAAGFPVEISRDGKSFVNAASPLRLLTLKVKQGEVIQVRANTDDTNAAEELFARLANCIAE